MVAATAVEATVVVATAGEATVVAAAAGGATAVGKAQEAMRVATVAVRVVVARVFRSARKIAKQVSGRRPRENLRRPGRLFRLLWGIR